MEIHGQELAEYLHRKASIFPVLHRRDVLPIGRHQGNETPIPFGVLRKKSAAASNSKKASG